MSPTETIVVREVERLLFCSVEINDSLYDLGADSLVMLELWSALERSTGTNFEVGLLTEAASLREIAAALEGLVGLSETTDHR